MRPTHRAANSGDNAHPRERICPLARVPPRAENMVVRTDTRRDNAQSETLTAQQPVALPAQSLFVGLPGAYAQQGFAPLGFAPIAAPFGAPALLTPYGPIPGQGIPYGATPYAPWYGAFQGQPFQGIAPGAVQHLPPLGAIPGAAIPGPSIPVAVQDLGREVVATSRSPASPRPTSTSSSATPA